MVNLLNMETGYSVSMQRAAVPAPSGGALGAAGGIGAQAVPAVQDGAGVQAYSGDKNKTGGSFDSYECSTCSNRKYVDGSNDPSVSFKTPTSIEPDRAAAAVRGHEMEHVFNERAKAASEGKEVVSQSVLLKTGLCSECGRVYIAGGTTTTVTKSSSEQSGASSRQPAADGGGE